ncbi:hypothetical protein BJ170DRAFT_729809 [Xylariales sp. AK1849]|nr:hypothetical protein BJ170DRAFT_729809 [Xylariales sp. AK1849]
MSDRAPLLVQFSESGRHGDRFGLRSRYHRSRRAARRFLSSRAKHWLVLALIMLDVAGIFTDIFIALITCELDRQDEKWVEPTRSALTSFSLVLSCLFLIELMLSLWAEGLQYLSRWVACFDAFVIVTSFAIDLLEHNVAEEIASLVVILRLWRFVKVANEFNVEATEQQEETKKRIEHLEKENADLKEQLGRNKPQQDEEAGDTSQSTCIWPHESS